MMTVPACLVRLDLRSTPGAGRLECVRITLSAVPAVVEHVPTKLIQVRRPPATAPTASARADTSLLGTPPRLQLPHSHTSCGARA